MKRYVIAFGAMILLLGGLFFFNIGSGSVRMTGSEIADILLRRFGGTADETARQIVWESAFPGSVRQLFWGERSQLRDFCYSHFFRIRLRVPMCLASHPGRSLWLR